jgi:hypothetical protein
MNAIINSKNALSALFLIPILKSAIAMAMPKEGNSVTLGLIYMFLYLVVGLACFYLAKTDNEYITTKKQRIGMYILSAYSIVLEVIVWRLLVLINEDWNILYFFAQLFGDETIGTTIGAIMYGIFDLTYLVAFVMFIWGIPTSKSYKTLITIVFFAPLIPDIILDLLTITVENILDYKDLISRTINIACDGLMFYLIFKAYKRKNEIE